MEVRPMREKQTIRRSTEPVYMIGVAARLCGLHPQTLRLYERLGLVQPARLGSQKRLYSDEDIERLKRIQHFTQQLGVNLAGVDVILRLLDRIDRMHQEMEHFIDQTNNRIRQLVDEHGLPVDVSVLEIRFERFEEEDEP